MFKNTPWKTDRHYIYNSKDILVAEVYGYGAGPDTARHFAALPEYAALAKAVARFKEAGSLEPWDQTITSVIDAHDALVAKLEGEA